MHLPHINANASAISTASKAINSNATSSKAIKGEQAQPSKPSASSLVEFARNAPLDAAYADTFRAVGTGSVEQAIDTFFSTARTPKEGLEAYEDLTQVQLALKEANRRTQREIKTNQTAGNEKAASSELPKEKRGSTSFHPPYGGGMTIQGEFHTKFTKAEVRGPQAPDLSGIEKMIKSMGEVIPLFAASVMAPGPLAVSLKNQLQEVYSGTSSASAGSSNFHIEQSASLLSLGGSARVTSGSSASQSSSEFSAVSDSIDERVIPKLHNLRGQLERLGMAAPVEGTIFAFGQTHFTSRTYSESKDEKVKLGTHDYNPSHLKLQAKRTGPASGLSHHASTAPLGSELADTLRTEGGESLRNSLATLFNPERTLQDGRKAYDSLVDLSRAFETLSQRQPTLSKETGKFSPDYALAKFAADVDNLAPLFASVAMVPGEMESSVSNHAKEQVNFSSQGSSRSVNSVAGESFSILPPAYSSERGSSHSSSSHKTNFEYQSTTTDEILTTKLHDLRERLSAMEGVDFDKATQEKSVFVGWDKGGNIQPYKGRDGGLYFAS